MSVPDNSNVLVMVMNIHKAFNRGGTH